MGGRPLAAMNLLAFPCSMGAEVVGEVVRGSAEKVLEAGAVTVGGHTIDDAEPKFGLAVMGVVHPERIVTNAGAAPGQVIMLTKPVGTGIAGTAVKRGLETEESIREIIDSMATLNRSACEAMLVAGAHAATDVTGFGLVGHLHEMALASGCAADIDLTSVPVFDRMLDHAMAGVVPGRTADVTAWAADFITWESTEDRDLWMRVLCDPQTSGGLLVALSPEEMGVFEAELVRLGGNAVRVGEFREGTPGAVTVL